MIGQSLGTANSRKTTIWSTAKRQITYIEKQIEMNERILVCWRRKYIKDTIKKKEMKMKPIERLEKL